MPAGHVGFRWRKAMFFFDPLYFVILAPAILLMLYAQYR